MSINKTYQLLESIIREANDLIPYTGDTDDIIEGEVIKGEVVEDDDKPLENELEKEHSEEFKKVTQKCYAVIQTSNTAILTVVKTSEGNVLTTLKRQEILELLNECNLILKGIAENEVVKLQDEEESHTASDTINYVLEDNQELEKELKKKNKVVTKKDIFDRIEDIYSDFEDIFKAELPKNLISAVAMASPLTAIVYQNADLLKGVTKAGYNTVKRTVRDLRGYEEK